MRTAGWRDGGSIEVVAAVEQLIFAAVALTARSLAATPGAIDLTIGQWRILALLHGASGPVRLSALAGTMGMSMPSASRMVARLGARGLVSSAVDPEDRRAVLLSLTKHGSQVVDVVLHHRRRVVSDALADLRLPARAVGHLVAVAEGLTQGAASA